MTDESFEAADGPAPDDQLDAAAASAPEPAVAIPLPPSAPMDPVTPQAGTDVPPPPVPPPPAMAAPVTPEQPAAPYDAAPPTAPATPEPPAAPYWVAPPATPAPTDAAYWAAPPTNPVTPEQPAVTAPGLAGGAYALGALAGNPHLAPTSGPVYGGPPYGGAPYGGPSYGPPTASMPPHWSPPPDPGAAAGSHRFRTVAAVTGAVVIALAAGAGISHAAWKSNAPSRSASPPSISTQTPGSSGSSGTFGSPFGSGSGNSGASGNSGSTGGAGPSDTSAIAAKVDPGLVDIDTTLGYQSEEAAGTGIVLTSSGEILTNNHVIDGATTISATDVGNGKTYSASVVGYNRTNDIAVLQLHNASGLQTATLSNSSNISVGQDVVGVGNAGGSGGTPSAAGGTVTALNQSITASDEGDGSSEQLNGLIETNANIQAGDSGGSLVNTSGQVIGVDTAASAGFSFQGNGQSSGQGYAIPINEAVAIAGKIELSQASSTIHIGPTAFLGVSIQPASDAGNGSSIFGGGGGFGSGSSGSGSGQSTTGVSIAQVFTSSPAQEAGLAEGDIIATVNGKTITTPSELTNLLEPDHPGDKITLGWIDTSGQSHTATIQLSSGPPQ